MPANRLPCISSNSAGRSGRGRGPRGMARRPRRGAAAVEFALIAPVLFLMIFGMIEFGRAVMVQQILTNASREGARRAILEQTTLSEVETIVGDYLTDTSIPGASVSVSVNPLSSMGFGDPVTVTCSIPYAQVTWLPTPKFFAGKTLTGRSVMRADRPE
jgi:Flp pilus assembly protein TadG